MKWFANECAKKRQLGVDIRGDVTGEEVMGNE
jgi:hypothetical protein